MAADLIAHAQSAGPVSSEERRGQGARRKQKKGQWEPHSGFFGGSSWPLGRPFWGSSGPLGASFWALGSPKAGLPRPEGSQDRFWGPKEGYAPPLGATLGAFLEPKSDKMMQTHIKKATRFSRAKTTLLETLLGHLGPIWGQNGCHLEGLGGQN